MREIETQLLNEIKNICSSNFTFSVKIAFIGLAIISKRTHYNSFYKYTHVLKEIRKCLGQYLEDWVKNTQTATEDSPELKLAYLLGHLYRRTMSSAVEEDVFLFLKIFMVYIEKNFDQTSEERFFEKIAALLAHHMVNHQTRDFVVNDRWMTYIFTGKTDTTATNYQTAVKLLNFTIGCCYDEEIEVLRPLMVKLYRFPLNFPIGPNRAITPSFTRLYLKSAVRKFDYDGLTKDFLLTCMVLISEILEKEDYNNVHVRYLLDLMTIPIVDMIKFFSVNDVAATTVARLYFPVVDVTCEKSNNKLAWFNKIKNDRLNNNTLVMLAQWIRNISEDVFVSMKNFDGFINFQKTLIPVIFYYHFVISDEFMMYAYILGMYMLKLCSQLYHEELINFVTSHISKSVHAKRHRAQILYEAQPLLKRLLKHNNLLFTNDQLISLLGVCVAEIKHFIKSNKPKTKIDDLLHIPIYYVFVIMSNLLFYCPATRISRIMTKVVREHVEEICPILPQKIRKRCPRVIDSVLELQVCLIGTYFQMSGNSPFLSGLIDQALEGLAACCQVNSQEARSASDRILRRFNNFLSRQDKMPLFDITPATLTNLTTIRGTSNYQDYQDINSDSAVVKFLNSIDSIFA